MPQFIETYIAYFAILKIGCIVLPLFSGYGSKAVIERLNIAKAKGIFTVDKTFRKAKEIRMFDLIKNELQKVKSLEKIFLLGKDKGKKIFNWENFENVSENLKTEEMEAEDPAIIHFTSGTTGKPKGCVYTHIGLVTKMAFDGCHIISLDTDLNVSSFFYLNDIIHKIIEWRLNPMFFSNFRDSTTYKIYFGFSIF